MSRFIKFIGVAVLGLALMLTSCDGKKEKENNDFESEEVKGLIVENTISTDRESAFLNFSNDYRWFETCIDLEKYLDEENNGVVLGVSNVFQVVEDRDSDGYDTRVILYAHAYGESTIEVKDYAFWVGDLPLNEEEIKLTFKDAFDRLMQANLPKPHSKHCVLRKELGPKNCNPQYIFGNTKSQVYVDAVTGCVTDKNPVYEGFDSPREPSWP